MIRGDVPRILAAIEQTGVSVEKIWRPMAISTMSAAPRNWRDALNGADRGPTTNDKSLLDNVVTSGARFG